MLRRGCCRCGLPTPFQSLTHSCIHGNCSAREVISFSLGTQMLVLRWQRRPLVQFRAQCYDLPFCHLSRILATTAATAQDEHIFSFQLFHACGLQSPTVLYTVPVAAASPVFFRKRFTGTHRCRCSITLPGLFLPLGAPWGAPAITSRFVCISCASCCALLPAAVTAAFGSTAFLLSRFAADVVFVPSPNLCGGPCLQLFQ